MINLPTGNSPKTYEDYVNVSGSVYLIVCTVTGKIIYSSTQRGPLDEIVKNMSDKLESSGWVVVQHFVNMGFVHDRRK